MDSYVFLEDGIPDTTDHLPINLGQYPFDCLGNIRKCPDGFTVRFQLQVTPGNPQLAQHYLVSTGGQSPLSEGWYFRQNYGKDYEVGVALRERLWTTSFNLQTDQNIWLAMMWTPQGLTVYVDGLLSATDVEGVPRVFSESVIDLFPNIVIGGANSELWLDHDEGLVPDVDIANLKHWAKALSVDEAFVGTGKLF